MLCTECSWWAHDGCLFTDVHGGHTMGVHGGAESLLGGVGLSCVQAEEVLEMVLILGEVLTDL